MKYHGVEYVWARPKHKQTMMLHVAQQFEGTLQAGSANLFGKTYFKCQHYNEIWPNTKVDAVPFTKYPSHEEGCYWCWNRVEEFEAKIEKAKMLLNPSDEEDIVVEVPKRSKLDKSCIECVKCFQKYPMDNALYTPDDSADLEIFSEFHGLGRKVYIYRCTCGHPLVIKMNGTVTTWSKVLIGRPIVVV